MPQNSVGAFVVSRDSTCSCALQWVPPGAGDAVHKWKGRQSLIGEVSMRIAFELIVLFVAP